MHRHPSLFLGKKGLNDCTVSIPKEVEAEGSEALKTDVKFSVNFGICLA